MGPNLITILSVVCFIASAAAVTLYNVAATPAIHASVDESVTFSAAGVDSGGSTTYVGTGVQSLIVLFEGTTTETILSTPLPFAATFVEDKLGYHDDNVLSCTFMAGGEGTGTCVGVEVVVGKIATPLTTTYTISGSVVPWTTIRDPGPTAAPNGAGRLPFPSILTVICLSVVYLLL